MDITQNNVFLWLECLFKSEEPHLYYLFKMGILFPLSNCSIDDSIDKMYTYLESKHNVEKSLLGYSKLIK